MSLTFKNKDAVEEQRVIDFRPVPVGIPHLPQGIPAGIPSVNMMQRVPIAKRELPPLAMPGSNLKRAIHYQADFGGCGYWRMIFPELLLNINQKAIVNGLTTMVLDPRFYNGVKAVRLQRQATPMQLEFVKFLKKVSADHEFKVIYEIDDIIFKDDIPDFNRCKTAFDNDDVLKSAMEMMSLSDEITVTCEFMKQYYMDKTGNKNITVIPNYPPKLWFDGYYDENRINQNYNTFKKRPRVGYCGSGTHIDVANKTGQNDDFTHIVEYIIKTRNDFQWVMMGAYPLAIKPFIDRGEIELAPWSPLLYYPKAINSLNLNATIAPLQDNNFNKAKSEIKYLEAACLGIPGVYQDLITYKNAPLRFTNGNDLIDKLKYLLTNEDMYMNISKQGRTYSETMWLDDHLGELINTYFGA